MPWFRRTREQPPQDFSGVTGRFSVVSMESSAADDKFDRCFSAASNEDKTEKNEKKGDSDAAKCAKEGQAKRKKMLNTHLFFSQLNEREKDLFAIVTEDISLQNTSGLQNIKRKLWKGKAKYRIMTVAFMMCQLLLNCYTVAKLTLHVMLPDSGTDIALKSNMLEVCSNRLYPTCFQTELSRLFVTQALCCLEAGVVFIMACLTLLSSVSLLVRGDPVNYVKYYHFTILVLPKLACKFSLISFLHVVNAERLKSILLRGELRCLVSVCWRARPKDRKVAPEQTNAAIMAKNLSGRVSEIFGLLTVGFVVMLALHMLLVKLFMVYFAAIFSYYTWTFEEWLFFMGFVNQLSGLSLSTEIEMLRILLFKFGGEDTRWGLQQIEACGTYFQYFASRTVEQVGRVRSVVIFWSMASADLQSLFQGHQRLHEQVKVRNEAKEMFQKLKDPEQLVEMRESLLSNFQATQHTLNSTLRAAPTKERLKLLNELQTRAVGQLRLAARVQEHIWEWNKVELLEQMTLSGSCCELEGDTREETNGETVAAHINGAGGRECVDSGDVTSGEFSPTNA
eukprot:TRINITY_DN30589_c0_g1_i1.p1 TRINITY_DN30589_c0_g1~~TRINITY_DN30589_c0_g1_i1.p1  ORF type:complete len:565 (+),score=76.52 TRINITY_DN30589_c0_g1_i1:54-1748(+)